MAGRAGRPRAAGVYTTDNGDELRFTGTGTAVAIDLGVPRGTYSATDQFTDRTGRYADVTGQEHVTVTYDPNAKTLTITVDGDVATTG
jgi:hypothetical protein